MAITLGQDKDNVEFSHYWKNFKAFLYQKIVKLGKNIKLSNIYYTSLIEGILHKNKGKRTLYINTIMTTKLLRAIKNVVQ